MSFSLEKLSCTLPFSPMRATRLKRRVHFPAPHPSARYAAPALDKGLDILELFASEPDGLTTSQVARRLGRTVGEIFRMLVCLAERGYISQVLPDERFQLTLKLFELAHRHHPLQRFVAKARPLMEEVAHKTRQSCHLAMPSDGEVVVITQVDAPGSAGFALRVGAKIHSIEHCFRAPLSSLFSPVRCARALPRCVEAPNRPDTSTGSAGTPDTHPRTRLRGNGQLSGRGRREYQLPSSKSASRSHRSSLSAISASHRRPRWPSASESRASGSEPGASHRHRWAQSTAHEFRSLSHDENGILR